MIKLVVVVVIVVVVVVVDTVPHFVNKHASE